MLSLTVVACQFANIEIKIERSVEGTARMVPSTRVSDDPEHRDGNSNRPDRQTIWTSINITHYLGLSIMRVDMGNTLRLYIKEATLLRHAIGGIRLAVVIHFEPQR